MSGQQEKSLKKHTIAEMVQTALLTLNERGGSTRQAIWKCIEAKFPESNYKQFLVRLKKLSETSQHIIKVNPQVFKLEPKFKKRAEEAIKRGETVHKAVTYYSTHDGQSARKKLKAQLKKEKAAAAKKEKSLKTKAKKEAAKAKAAEKKA